MLTPEFAAFADELLGDWRPLRAIIGNAERELDVARRQAQELAAGIAASSDLFCTLSPMGLIETANPRWSVLGVGAPRMSLWLNHVAEMDRERAAAALASEGSVDALLVRMRAAGGAIAPVCWSFTPAMQHGNRVGVGRICANRALCQAERPNP